MRNSRRFLLWNSAVLPSLPRFTVSFNIITDGSGVAPDLRTVEASSSITLPGSSGFSRTGFNFAGWNTSIDGTGTDFSVGATFTPSENTTMFASWVPVGTFVVRFNANGAVGTVPELTANQGQSLTLPSGAGLVKTGQTFAGWNARPDGTGANHEAGSTFVSLGNITLYARWVSGFALTFDANGGSGNTPPAQTVNLGSGITLPNGDGLSKSGFTFGGWNTNANTVGLCRFGHLTRH